MLLVQDQYVQNSRKNFDNELQLKQNTSKQFSDPKDVWQTESGGEEVNLSRNDSEEEDNLLYADHSDLPEEVFQTRKPPNLRKKNVRFGGSDFNYVLDTSETSSFDNEYFGVDCGYYESAHRRSAPDPEINHKIKDNFRTPHKTRCRPPDCGYDKPRPKSSTENIPSYLDEMDRRPHSVGEYDSQKIRRKDHCCGHRHGDFDLDDITYKKPIHKPHKYGCGDDVTTRCCDHCLNDARPKTNFVKMKPMPMSGHKYVCHMLKDSEPDMKGHRKLREAHCEAQPVSYHAPCDRYCQDEYCEHSYSSKSKKKILEAVQEQQEQLSDSTYKVPCNNFSSQTIPAELCGFMRKRSSEKLGNSSQSDWLYYGGRGNGGSLGERSGPPRIHKMRSRRTRMNKIKIGWKKALVQTVRDGSRNERVGVIVMGSKGPEFYSKNCEKAGFMPFRRSKSFLDGAAKSFEVMTVDCKNVFLSSSEPCPRTNYAINDLVCPEDDDKVEEKIAKFSKNVNDIVKNSEEKFYKALSSSEFPEKKKPTEETFKGAVEGTQEGKKDEKKDDVLKSKYPPFHALPQSPLSPLVPKHLKKQDKVISEESKTMADALNEQAKKYLENQSNVQDEGERFLEGFQELKEKYTTKETNQEKVERNLSMWGMKLGHLPDRFDVHEQAGEGCKKTPEEKSEEKDKAGKDELSHTGSIKSTEQISLNKQRRKKYYESTTSGVKEAEAGGDADDVKSRSGAGSPKTPKRVPKMKKWESSESFHRQHGLKDADSNLISAVFRDLVENGCAISQEESENLQSIFNQVSYNAEMCSNEAMSSSSSEGMNTGRLSKTNVSGRFPGSPISVKEEKVCKEAEEGGKEKGRGRGYLEEEEAKESLVEKGDEGDKCEDLFEEVNSKKVLKMNFFDEKICKKVQRKCKEGKKKKIVLEDRMKLLREALPSIAAENEATHLKQLKRYIDRFIDRVEASTASEFCNRKENRPKSKSTSSTDSNEIRVDARKILEFVSNPFRKISSDVTISIAKKLTDALVQDKSSRCLKPSPPPTKGRKHSDNETDEEGFVPCEPSSGSERVKLTLSEMEKIANHSGKQIPSVWQKGCHSPLHPYALHHFKVIKESTQAAKTCFDSKANSDSISEKCDNKTGRRSKVEGKTHALLRLVQKEAIMRIHLIPERCEEPEPTYLKQLKKMRKEHLNNIVLEVKRLSELLRFLDRCNRLHF